MANDLPRSASALLCGFAAFAGARGVMAAFYVLAAALAEALTLSLLVPAMALIFSSGAMPAGLGRMGAALFALAGAQTPMGRLAVVLAALMVLMTVRMLLTSRRDLIIIELQLGFIESLRLELVERLVAADWGHLARLRHARILQLMTGDIQRLATGIQVILLLVVALAQLTAQFAVIFLLAPGLAALLLLLLAGGLAGLGRFLDRAHRLGNYVTEANLFLLDGTSQFLGGLKLAMGQNLQADFVTETAQTLRRIRQRQIGYARQQLLGHALLVLLSVLGAAMLVLAGYGWLHLAPSVLTTILLVVVRMLAPLAQLQQGARQIAEVLSVHDTARKLSAELKAAARRAGSGAQAPRGAITFDNVSYRHPASDVMPGQGGLQNLDLSVKEGEFLAITGESGVGKTTLMDLLAGLIVPQSGRLLVGGTVLDEAALPAWRDRLGYVAQEPFLFRDSIRRNLAWANAAAPEAQMWEVLAMTGADQMVRRLDRGLDSITGERGALFSGGERQRIGLARALLRQPDLLLLDEATGAIDDDGERDIFVRLRAAPWPMTIIAVAHRTRNLDLFDRVVRLENSQGLHRAAPAGAAW